MTALSNVSNVILDILIAAAALVAIYRAARYLAGLAGERWPADRPASDPAATEVWDVLAEARRITQEAAGAAE